MALREVRPQPDLAGAALSHGWEFAMRVPREQTLEGLLGLEITERRAGRVIGKLPVRDAIRQPAGPVHGGVYAAVAEALALVGTLDAVAHRGCNVAELSNGTSVLGPVTDGSIHGVARVRHPGRTTWLWDVELSDDAGRLCALSRVTFAVREDDAGSPSSSDGGP